MSKNGFEHYMMKEIYDTPGVIRKITEKCFVDSSAPCCNSKWFDIGIDKDFFKGIKDVCIETCGTARSEEHTSELQVTHVSRMPSSA